MERNSLVSDRRWWTLGVLCLSLLVIGLDNTILNVALPTLARDLDASSSQLQWIVDAYMLVFAGVLLTAGALGDRFGRKRALTFGLMVFGAGSIASALSASAGMLIASRGLMGIGGAFIMPSTLSILTATFRDPAERAKAIGVWAGVSGLGIAIGPVTGGWLIQHANWHWIFIVNVPFVLLALAAGRFFVPESRDPAAPRLDLRGFALSSAGLTALVWAIIEAPDRGWTDPAVLGALTGAALVLAALVAWELRAAAPGPRGGGAPARGALGAGGPRAPAPMLGVRLFRKPRFSAASVAISLAFFALFGLIFFLPQFLQSILGYDALEAGLRTMPVAGGLILGGPASAKLASRVGTKIVVAAGLGLVGTALLLLTGADADSGYGLVLAALLVLGFGMGCAMAPATEAIMGSLSLPKASVGSAVNDTTRTTGGALGVAVLGSVLNARYRGAMDHAVTGLPDRAARVAHDSLAGALAVAQRVGGAPGGRLAATAQDAFLSGMHAAAIVGAGVAFAGALVALAYLPARAAAPAGEPQAVPARGSAQRWSPRPPYRALGRAAGGAPGGPPRGCLPAPPLRPSWGRGGGGGGGGPGRGAPGRRRSRPLGGGAGAAGGDRRGDALGARRIGPWCERRWSPVSTAAAGAARPPGRPRSAAADQAILRA